ncbi:MAG: DUF302 domain-containing protein [Alphaproteobacteria bacterium]
MRSILYALVMVCAFNFVPANAAESTLTVKESTLGVKETIDKLAAALKAKGITIFARIDHAAGAKKVGLELRPTELLIFGNPKLGTPLMQTDQRVGLDLPMKVLAWEDAKGKVFVTYAPPISFKTEYNLDGKDAILQTMTKALAKFTTVATKK